MALIYGTTRPQVGLLEPHAIQGKGFETITPLADGTIVSDATKNTSFAVTLPANGTDVIFQDPTGIVEGVTYTWLITQPNPANTAGRKIWESLWFQKGGGDPNLSTDADKTDLLVAKAMTIGGKVVLAIQGDVSQGLVHNNSWSNSLGNMPGAYYTFNDVLTDPETFQDLEGGATTGAGTISPAANPTFAAGQIGNAVVFDGVTNCVTDGINAYWASGLGGFAGNDWSTSIWYKHNGDTGTLFQLCATTPILKLEVNSSTGFKPSYSDTAGVVKDDGFHLPAGGLVTGNWYHLVVTNATVTGTAIVKFYIDGALVNTHTVTGWDGTPPSVAAGDGMSTWGCAAPNLTATPATLTEMLDCSLDDHGLMSGAALVQSEISAIYTNGLAGIGLK